MRPVQVSPSRWHLLTVYLFQWYSNYATAPVWSIFACRRIRRHSMHSICSPSNRWFPILLNMQMTKLDGRAVISLWCVRECVCVCDNDNKIKLILMYSPFYQLSFRFDCSPATILAMICNLSMRRYSNASIDCDLNPRFLHFLEDFRGFLAIGVWNNWSICNHRRIDIFPDTAILPKSIMFSFCLSLANAFCSIYLCYEYLLVLPLKREMFQLMLLLLVLLTVLTKVSSFANHCEHAFHGLFVFLCHFHSWQQRLRHLHTNNLRP